MYAKNLLPLANNVVNGKQLDYNAMQAGIGHVLEAKIERLELLTAYVDLLENLRLLHAQHLKLQAGGSVPQEALPDRDFALMRYHIVNSTKSIFTVFLQGSGDTL